MNKYNLISYAALKFCKSAQQFIKLNKVSSGKMYHVTNNKNLSSIMKNGLIPCIGDNSFSYAEKDERVWLFPTLDDVKTALTGWLGELCDEGFFSLLEIDTSNIQIKKDIVDWEVYTTEIIPPNKIKILGDIDILRD